MDPRLFRSPEPRLIVEAGPDGAADILVLSDKGNASILLLVEFKDGQYRTEVLDLESNSVHLRLEAPEALSLRAVQAVLVGDGDTSVLRFDQSPKVSTNWNLSEASASPQNPGSSIDWLLDGESTSLPESLFWGL